MDPRSLGTIWFRLRQSGLLRTNGRKHRSQVLLGLGTTITTGSTSSAIGPQSKDAIIEAFDEFSDSRDVLLARTYSTWVDGESTAGVGLAVIASAILAFSLSLLVSNELRRSRNIRTVGVRSKAAIIREDTLELARSVVQCKEAVTISNSLLALEDPDGYAQKFEPFIDDRASRGEVALSTFINEMADLSPSLIAPFDLVILADESYLDLLEMDRAGLEPIEATVLPPESESEIRDVMGFGLETATSPTNTSSGRAMKISQLWGRLAERGFPCHQLAR